MSTERPRRPRPAPAKLLTLTQLALERGVDPRTVRRWVRVGCPVARRGKPGRAAPMFRATDVDAWLERSATREADLVRALAARQDARSRKISRDLLRLAERHLPAAEVRRVWQAHVADARQQTEAAAEALVPAVITASGVGIEPVERVLRDAVRALLTALAGDTAEASAPSSPPRPAPVATSSTVREAKAQSARFETRLLDLKESIAAGVMLPVDDVDRVWSARVTAYRAHVLNLPVTMADRLARAATLDGESEVRAVLAHAFAAAVAELNEQGRTAGR